jgi:hypothetical protein
VLTDTVKTGNAHLPVVDPDNPSKVVGYLGRSGIMAARARRLQEEFVREPGWIKRFMP